jgi:hypothetical protein
MQAMADKNWILNIVHEMKYSSHLPISQVSKQLELIRLYSFMYIINLLYDRCGT